MLEILRVTKKEIGLLCEPKGPCSPDCTPGGSCSPMCSPRVRSEGGENMELIKVTPKVAKGNAMMGKIKPNDYCRPCMPDWGPCPPSRKSKEKTLKKVSKF